MNQFTVVNAVLTSMHTICILYAVSKTLKLKRAPVYIFCTVCLLTTIYVINATVEAAPHTLLGAFSVLITLPSPIPFFRGNKVQAVATTAVFMVSSMLAEIIITLPMFYFSSGLGQTIQEFLWSNLWGTIILKLVFILLSVIMFIGAHRLLKRVWARGDAMMQNALLLLVPISQVIIIDLLILLLQKNQTMSEAPMTLILTIILSVVADIAYFRAIFRLQKEQDLRNLVWATEQQLNQQLSYYRQMNSKIELINGIRHDLNNQLRTAYTLLDQGETDVARQQLDHIRANLKSRTGPEYCPNLIVDAVLAEKAERCAQEKIRLQLSVQIPAEIPIEGAHLCSAFSNILDNAIAGCLESSAPEPSIRLQAAIHGGCILIECRNSAAEETAKPSSSASLLPEHGLGLGILHRLTELYDGSLETDRQTNCYITTLLLRLP